MGTFTINLGSTLSRSAHKQRGKTALVSPHGRRISYRDLNILSNQFANGLLKMGVKKGDHVAVLSLNQIEQVAAFFGIFKMGGVLVPVNARFAAPEMAWLLNHSNTKVLIFLKDFADLVNRFRGEVPEVQHFVMMGGDPAEGTISLEDLIGLGGKQDPAVEVSGEDEAVLLYTSGTTGRPKGAILTHNGFLWNCVNWVHNGLYREWDLSLQVFPLYHVAAIGSVLTYVYVGGTVYLKSVFDPEDCMKTIEREGITRWGAAPTVFNMLFQHPRVENYNTSNMELIGSGAAIMPTETQRRLKQVFPNARIFDTYGMTEASGGITTLLPEDLESKTACVGKEHISLELRVVDDSDCDLPPEQVGEIIFRGNNLMKGYYKDPEATREALRGGWMHTGDLGRMDEDGFLYIVDRKKDMIITGGENVFPREVEEVLYTHPRVSEAAVIGIPDPKWGEAVTAVVVLRAGQGASAEELVGFCRERIAGFKCPKKVEFVDALPRNPAGKILKRELKDRLTPPVL